MDRYEIIRPARGLPFSGSLDGVLGRLSEYLNAESSAGRGAVLCRFLLSDAGNQAALLREALQRCGAVPAAAVSIVEQPPLDGSRIAVLVHTSDNAGEYLFHSLRLAEEEAAGLDSYGQSLLLFEKYLGIIRPLGLQLGTHCVRTWIYVRDIDSNYSGMVRARNEVFEREGLEDHYIASTGIGGAGDVPSAVVAIDFLTCPHIDEASKTYLKALSHLSPTRDYGVAFERGVSLVGGPVFISGTASIDSLGRVLHEGDVLRQAGRLLDNVEALLSEAGKSLADVPCWVAYLRDISDYGLIDNYMQRRFPGIPRVLLEARVCRPAWLVEMECSL